MNECTPMVRWARDDIRFVRFASNRRVPEPWWNDGDWPLRNLKHDLPRRAR